MDLSSTHIKEDKSMSSRTMIEELKTGFLDLFFQESVSISLLHIHIKI